MTTTVDRRLARHVPALARPAFVPQYLAGAWFAGFDVALAVASFLVADAAIRASGLGVGAGLDDAATLGLKTGLVAAGIIAVQRGYTTPALRRARTSAGAFLWAWLAAFFVVGWAGFLTQSIGDASRATVAGAFALGFVGAVPMRYAALNAFAERMEGMRLATRRVILVHDGDRSAAQRIRAELLRNGVYAPVAVGSGARSDAVLAATCRRALARCKLDAVYLFVPWGDLPRYRALRDQLRSLPAPVYLFPEDGAAELLGGPVIDAGFARGLEVQRAPLDAFEQAQKRALDIAAAGTMLLLLAPFLLCVAAAIKLDSPGPALFMQTRRGFSGRRFRIYKFRSMRVAEDGAEIRQASRDDDRTTRLGRFLRASSIDELPQLLNVLKGDMSLVGPRPHALAHDEHYTRLIARYAHRHNVRPGLTGWAQVNGHRGATPRVGDMEARVTHDLWYIDHWSIGLDLRIIARTVLLVLRDRNAY